MKTWLIAALAAGVAVPVIAQTAQAPAAPAQAHRPMVETRAALGTHVQAMFTRLDTNRDGFVAKDEAQAARKAFRGARGDRKAMRGAHGAAMFDRMDANKDGSISRAEFDAAHQSMAAKMHGAPGKRIQMMHGAMSGRMFEMADADKDGRVSLAEATSAAAAHFDKADSNRDGTLTGDEMRAAHKAMRGKPAS